MGACRSKSASGWAKRTGSTTIVVQSKAVVEGEDQLAVDTNPPAPSSGKAGAPGVTAVPVSNPGAGSPGRTIPPVGAASTAPPAKTSTASTEAPSVPADTPAEAPSAPLTAAERRALAVGTWCRQSSGGFCVHASCSRYPNLDPLVIAPCALPRPRPAPASPLPLNSCS